VKILVIGAGATLEESIRLGITETKRPPLINNFGASLWNSNLALPQSLCQFMAGYLQANGHKAGPNSVDTFIRLEAIPGNSINVERFFEYAWLHRNNSYQGAWEDLLYLGVFNPLTCLFAENGFFENGVGWRQLRTYQAMAKKLRAGDLVVNLNYEPLFEMGAVQAEVKFAYVPLSPEPEDFLVAKPHGSFNMIVEKGNFYFSEPNIIGSATVVREERDIFRGIIPPRFDKTYQQHPIANRIFNDIRNYTPESVTFWGVGFNSSDGDLIDIYRGWCDQAANVFLIHPNPNSELNDAELMFKRPVAHLQKPEDW
jgi:hypothetical protein